MTRERCPAACVRGQGSTLTFSVGWRKVQAYTSLTFQTVCDTCNWSSYNVVWSYCRHREKTATLSCVLDVGRSGGLSSSDTRASAFSEVKSSQDQVILRLSIALTVARFWSSRIFFEFS